MSKDFETEPTDISRLGDAVREAFRPRTPAAQATASILARLPMAPPAPPRRLGPASARWSLAAGILLVAGLLGGFVLGRQGGTDSPKAAAIDVRIANLSGTVLVKHEGEDTWHKLTATSTIRLGDRLDATGNSAVTLLLWDRSSLRMAANTTLSADAFNGRVEFALRSGTIKADLQSAHPPFFIRTPQGTLEALGTEFTVSVD